MDALDAQLAALQAALKDDVKMMSGNKQQVICWIEFIINFILQIFFWIRKNENQFFILFSALI